MTPAVSPWRTTQPSMSRATSTTGRPKKVALSRLLIELCARVRELLAHPVQRRPALGDLALQPGALGEHGVELVVERVGVAREVLEGELGERAARGDRL